MIFVIAYLALVILILIFNHGAHTEVHRSFEEAPASLVLAKNQGVSIGYPIQQNHKLV